MRGDPKHPKRPPCWNCEDDAIENIKTMFVDAGQKRSIALGQVPAERAVFRKLHGVAHGSFVVQPKLPRSLARGVFGNKSYPVWVRFSSDTLPSSPDLKSTCGIGIKLFNVSGRKLLGDGDTQDFLLQNNEVFFVDNAQEMCAFTSAGVIDRNYDAYLAKHPKTETILAEMAKDEASVLTATYWSGLPYKLGRGQYVKYKLVPENPEGYVVDAPDYLAADLRRRLAEGEARFKFMVQLRSDPESMPLDEATVAWSEAASPPIHVATLVLAQQDTCARGQAEYGQQLSFNPWHSLAQHEPVGSLSEARKVAYTASSEARHEANGTSPREPGKPRAVAKADGGEDTCIVKAAIYPPIGVARVGNSEEEWFLGPEVTEPIAREAAFYRDAGGKLKRQAARFRIFGLDAEGHPVRELVGDEVDIEWEVHLANQKSAWYQFQIALDIPEAASAAPSLLRNADVANREDLVIDGSRLRIKNRGAKGGKKTFVGRFMGKSVELGELRTDDQGRLIVLGGFGRSASYNDSVAVTFSNNDTWHDDVSDGPVTAKVRYGGVELEVLPAWVTVAPPDYAPMQKGVRTMWDLMRDVAIKAGMLTAPARPSFSRDILPIFQRMSHLQWVNAGFAASFGWKAPLDFTLESIVSRLADNSPAHLAMRRNLFHNFRNANVVGDSPADWPYLYGDGIEVPSKGSPQQYTQVSDTQIAMLEQWVAGHFENDYDPSAVPVTVVEDLPQEEQADMLTRAAMEFCLADAFHPGCEMTWPMRHASMYMAPFRLLHPTDKEGTEPFLGVQLDAGVLGLERGPLHGGQYPGGLTRWMAIPWQTDTSSCRSGYEPAYDPYLPTFWPAAVPNQVMSDDQYKIVVDESQPIERRRGAFAYREDWDIPLDLDKGYTEQINHMVDHFDDMGVVTVRPGPGGEFPKQMQVADRNKYVKEERQKRAARIGDAPSEREAPASSMLGRPSDIGHRFPRRRD